MTNRTQIDARKEAADFRIIDAGRTYTLRANSGAPVLAGPGITARATAGTYEVTKVALRRIEAAHNVHPDF